MALVAVTLSSCSSNQHSDLPAESQQPIAKTEKAAKKLKILNWNVLYGFNHGKSIDAGSHWIGEQAPDVLALQELNGNTAAGLAEKAAAWGHQYSAIHKEQGFPVGLTSNAPIEVIERVVEGFHHGYLHCKTHDVHFFVVHFWPKKDHEAAAIIEKIKPLLDANQKVVVLGDFNTHSHNDAEFLKNSAKVDPLYDVVNSFESFGFVDLVYKHDMQPPQARQANYSFPSPITIPKWTKTVEELKSKRQRIDFIFASNSLASRSTSGKILISDELDSISDHYPVLVELKVE
jgi:endonuclease/exonuclease/phosphatase family metal-dependent hydrolase